MAETQTRVVERNGSDFGACPNCSRLYPLQDKGGPVEMPRTCRRCGSPTDPTEALRFADQQAERGHDPRIRAMGERMRGMPAPSADKMVTAPAIKK